ncbi:MAG: AMP-binding protein [Clostridia bacterium]|nr:AMP-binding protein [Clostridia bacterium]MDH7573085.1 AMP-binding protein [Clostridia bacterium]
MRASVWETFVEAAERFPARTALIYQGTEFTYAELRSLCERLAGAMCGLGIRKGDRVIVYMSHCPQWVITWFAVQRLGAVAVPVTHFYGSHDLNYITADSGAQVVFCTDANFENVAEIAEERSLRHIVVTTTAEMLPGWRGILDAKVAAAQGKQLPQGEKVKAYVNLLRDGGEAPPYGGIAPGDLAEILYTSGTTGLPKGVPLAHDVFLQAADVQRAGSKPLIPIGRDVVLQGSPLYHVLGQNIGLGALLAGDTLVLLPSMSIDTVLEAIDRYRITTLFGTPTFFRMILEHPTVDQYDLSSLIWCYTGGDYLPPALIDRWQQKVGRYIYQGLGATEASGGITMTPAEGKIPDGTVGKPLSVWKVKLIDPDSMETVGPPGQGELLISSDCMVRSYWNKPEETAERFLTLDGRLWYRTGDILRIDEEGWVYFLDRSGDIIKHKGYRVVPSKLERVLTEHPAVSAACAIGLPDPDVGEKIKALVVLNREGPGVRPEELLAWCKERLASYEVPHWIEFRDTLPTSPSGKILRRKVRTEERQKLGL